MARKLFCQISPLTYALSVAKCRALRHLADLPLSRRFAAERPESLLPVVIYQHNSLIRRTLGNVDMALQENKAVNLSLAAPRVDHILIRPGQIFSLWRLVGNPTARKGYREGLTITLGGPAQGIGGGLCQLSNLINWMVLHSDLTILEHHHHDGVDLFPDFNRQIPFGTGTSILYNYLDYRFQNNTGNTYQLLVRTSDTHLLGELRAEKSLPHKYHIRAEGEGFVREGEAVFRTGTVVRSCVDKATGRLLSSQVIKENHARVLYDCANLTVME